jgi:hypothetical protein
MDGLFFPLDSITRAPYDNSYYAPGHPPFSPKERPILIFHFEAVLLKRTGLYLPTYPSIHPVLSFIVPLRYQFLNFRAELLVGEQPGLVAVENLPKSGNRLQNGSSAGEHWQGHLSHQDNKSQKGNRSKPS